jgi:glycosyltransferase involved in cell wall biosynthesis
VIAICDNDGEIARLVEQYQCGGGVEPGHPDALVNLILRLSTDSTIRDEMGRRARAMLDAHFTRRQALERWCDLLQRVGDRARAFTR